MFFTPPIAILVLIDPLLVARFVLSKTVKLSDCPLRGAAMFVLVLWIFVRKERRLVVRVIGRILC
jgi:hypothetical protein